MRFARSSSESNTTARPSASNKRGSAAERFRMAPRGARLPKSATRPPVSRTGCVKGRTTARSTQLRIVEPVAKRLARHHAALQMQEVPDLAQDRRHAAGRVQVLHVVLASRLQVDQDWRGVAQLVQPVQVDLVTQPPGNGRKVDHRVGRSADRQQDTKRILDRFFRDDLARPDRLADEIEGDTSVSSAMRRRSASTAGYAALFAGIMPSVSAMIAIVLAVPSRHTCRQWTRDAARRHRSPEHRFPSP